jgi:hypothetical protein
MSVSLYWCMGAWVYGSMHKPALLADSHLLRCGLTNAASISPRQAFVVRWARFSCALLAIITRLALQLPCSQRCIPRPHKSRVTRYVS